MKAMQPLEYLHLQLRLEGREVSDGCLLRQVEKVPGEELPLMLIAQLANHERVKYYDEALPPALQKELSGVHIEFPKVEPLLDVLQPNHSPVEVGHYKTYVFPSQPAGDADVLCLSKQDPGVKNFEFDGFANEVYGIVSDGKLISACISTRENENCGEAWVYTAPDHRKHGFAQRVVNAWAGSLLEAGKVPFYSHNITNEASANLARKLGLQAVYEEITITQAA